MVAPPVTHLPNFVIAFSIKARITFVELQLAVAVWKLKLPITVSWPAAVPTHLGHQLACF